MAKSINPLLLIGGVGLLTVGSQLLVVLYRAYWGADDIWWTPAALMLSLEETQGDFEVFVAGEPLGEQLAAGSLAVSKGGVARPVAVQEISVRLNNWQKVKSSFLGHATYMSFLFGASCALLAVGLAQMAARRRKGGASQMDCPDDPQPPSHHCMAS